MTSDYLELSLNAYFWYLNLKSIHFRYGHWATNDKYFLMILLLELWSLEVFHDLRIDHLSSRKHFDINILIDGLN